MCVCMYVCIIHVCMCIYTHILVYTIQLMYHIVYQNMILIRDQTITEPTNQDAEPLISC